MTCVTKKLVNDCGTFLTDSSGVLLDFIRDERNADPDAPDDSARMLELIIPEGVKVLGEDAFRGCAVLRSFSLPRSLLILGTGYGCAFAGSQLPDVTIPDTLDTLGTYAFGCSAIRSLHLPREEKWPYARQFKCASIGTLYLASRYRVESDYTDPAMHIGGAGYLRSLNCNNVRIGAIEWYD